MMRPCNRLFHEGIHPEAVYRFFSKEDSFRMHSFGLKIVFPLLIVLMALSGCEQQVIIRGDLTDATGRPVAGVVDIMGHALPGVAVSVFGSEEEAVTDALGQYRLRCAPGNIRVDLMKTGYTPGRLLFEEPTARNVEARQAVLWPLPTSKGVFFFEDGRYRDLTRAVAESFRDESGQPLWALKKSPQARTAEPMPFLVGFRVPGYDVGLYKMTRTEAEAANVAGAASGIKYPVWVPETTHAILAAPIDEPDRLLTEFRVAEPLEPGAYAVHWGALDGYRSTEEMVFFFRVVSQEELEGEGEGEGSVEDEAPTRPGDDESPDPGADADSGF
jgi:hypothetical protein